LPAVIYGAGVRPGACRVHIDESSQFASALLLCARVGRWRVSVVGQNSEEAPYVVLTQKLIEAFGRQRGMFQIEPDASSASYIWAANWLFRLQVREVLEKKHNGNPEIRQYQEAISDLYNRPNIVRVAAFPNSKWQIDAAFPDFLPLPKKVSRQSDLGDSIMTAIVLAPLFNQVTRFTDLERLRVQECERVVALRTELTKCGARVEEHGQTLDVFPSPLHGATIETYNDHRMAMCFAILGLKIPGIKIINPACVKKTFPNFFQKLALGPPEGLGVTILDGKTGKALPVEELYAD